MSTARWMQWGVLAACASLLEPGLARPPASLGQEPDDAQRPAAAAAPAAERVDWRVIQFGWPGTEARRVKKVRVTFSKLKDSPFSSGVAGEQGVDVNIPEQDLGLLESFLAGASRPNVPEDVHGAVGAAYSVGALHVTSTDAEFVVGIGMSGFTLGAVEPDIQRSFTSWELARYLDDLLFAQAKKRLPNDMFQAMSGELGIEAQKRRYWRRVDERAPPKK